MHPVCFHIGSWTVYWYGVMVALGFPAVVLYWSFAGRREGRPPGSASDLAFWIILGGILGARLVYVALNWGYYRLHQAEIVMIHRGGLVFYGGLLGGTVAVLLLARFRRESPWGLGDFVLSGLPLGHALGRIGCFLNGCCYGSPTACAAAVTFPPGSAPAEQYGTIPLHPTQLYETGLDLLLFVLLAWRYRRRAFNGEIVGYYLVGYGTIRFVLEFIRGDNLPLGGGLTIFQWASLLFIVCGLLVLLLRRGRPPAATASP